MKRRFPRTLTRREQDIIVTAEKEFRLSMLRELSLQRFLIPFQSLTKYQEWTIKNMYVALQRRMRVWE